MSLFLTASFEPSCVVPVRPVRFLNTRRMSKHVCKRYMRMPRMLGECTAEPNANIVSHFENLCKVSCRSVQLFRIFRSLKFAVVHRMTNAPHDTAQPRDTPSITSRKDHGSYNLVNTSCQFYFRSHTFKRQAAVSRLFHIGSF
jgi:hypothetical protein